MDMEKTVAPHVDELHSRSDVVKLVQQESMIALNPIQGLVVAVTSYIALSVSATWFFSIIGGSNCLLAGLMSGFLLLGIGSVLLMEVFERQRTQQVSAYLNQHHWKLREGLPHPTDRTDTHPRWELMRTAEGGQVIIDIRRWEYIDGTWTLVQQSLCQSLRRAFTLEELEDADAYADGLIATAQQHLDKQEELEHQQLIAAREHIAVVSDRQQLANRWLQQRPASEVVDAQQLPPANNHKLLS